MKRSATGREPVALLSAVSDSPADGARVRLSHDTHRPLNPGDPKTVPAMHLLDGRSPVLRATIPAGIGSARFGTSWPLTRPARN